LNSNTFSIIINLVTIYALFGNDIATFPDFPAEIRAPIGTLPGVSGFQLHIGSNEILTPGDTYDVLVALNAAALKVNLKSLKPNGIIIANSDGFDEKNLRLAKIDENDNPLHNGSLDAYQVFTADITKLTNLAVAEFGLGNKEAERALLIDYARAGLVGIAIDGRYHGARTQGGTYCRALEN
jgi:2-oxoglutarate ferredoxin oxidoreductase subunit alpha